MDRKELMKNIQYINHPRSYLGLTRGGVEAIFSDKRRLIDIEIEIADYIESEIAKAEKKARYGVAHEIRLHVFNGTFKINRVNVVKWANEICEQNKRSNYER